MFGFKDFLIESSLKDLIGSVPQNQKWHGEGNVGVHTKLVQKQLNQAITTFQDLVRSPNSPLSEMNPEFTQEDRNLLRVAAWTHDLGKASSTTADGMDWRNAPPNPDKITSPKHEMPHHFNPNAQELLKSNMWRSIFDKVSFEDKKDLWFVIRNHMSLLEGGLSRKLLRRFIQPNGKYINNRRLKLLLTFILMDRGGRLRQEPDDPVKDMLTGLNAGSDWIKKINTKQTEPASDDPFEFIKGKPPHILAQALKGKFGRDFSPEEIQALTAGKTAL